MISQCHPFFGVSRITLFKLVERISCVSGVFLAKWREGIHYQHNRSACPVRPYGCAFVPLLVYFPVLLSSSYPLAILLGEK